MVVVGGVGRGQVGRKPSRGSLLNNNTHVGTYVLASMCVPLLAGYTLTYSVSEYRREGVASELGRGAKVQEGYGRARVQQRAAALQ